MFFAFGLWIKFDITVRVTLTVQVMSIKKNENTVMFIVKCIC